MQFVMRVAIPLVGAAINIAPMLQRTWLGGIVNAAVFGFCVGIAFSSIIRRTIAGEW